MDAKKARIYLAGGLFNAGERLHNLFLENELRELGYEVLLPQREALNFFDGVNFDVAGIVASCRKSSADPVNIFVGSVDGPDADSGTCVEYGIATTANRGAIVYRTDLRTALDREVGVNAMLQGGEVVFIYHPCFFTELSQVKDYYKNLACKISCAILSLPER
jgi:nucleoside 2-deoxyribosyltransferase